MAQLSCPHCGSDAIDLIVSDGEDETLLCTECGHEQPVSPAGV